MENGKAAEISQTAASQPYKTITGSQDKVQTPKKRSKQSPAQKCSTATTSRNPGVIFIKLWLLWGLPLNHTDLKILPFPVSERHPKFFNCCSCF